MRFVIAHRRLLAGCAALIVGPPALALHALDAARETIATTAAAVSTTTLSSLELDLPATPETLPVARDDSKTESNADHTTDDPDDEPE